MRGSFLPFLTLLMVFTACATTREKEIRTLAREIGKAENKLKQQTVAIFTPEIHGTSDAAEARELVELLTHEIVTGSNLKVAERSRLKDVLKEHELAQSGAADPATAARLGRLLLVDAVLIGSITGKSGKTEVFLRLVDSETALILQTARAELPATARERQSGMANDSATQVAVKPAKSKIAERRLQANLTPQTNQGTLEANAEAQGRLTDMSYRKGGVGGYHQVIGRVENIGSELMNDPTVSLQLYNSAGTLIGGSACLSPDRPLLAGQKLPFSCLFKPSADFARYEVSLDTTTRLYSSRALSLTAKDVKFRKETGSLTGDYKLSGVLTNHEETSVTYPRILVSLFDADGKFIGSASGFTVKKQLPPGASSPFVVTAYGYSLHGKPVSFEAFYSALPTRH